MRVKRPKKKDVPEAIITRQVSPSPPIENEIIEPIPVRRNFYQPYPMQFAPREMVFPEPMLAPMPAQMTPYMHPGYTIEPMHQRHPREPPYERPIEMYPRLSYYPAPVRALPPNHHPIEFVEPPMGPHGAIIPNGTMFTRPPFHDGHIMYFHPNQRQ